MVFDVNLPNRYLNKVNIVLHLIKGTCLFKKKRMTFLMHKTNTNTMTAQYGSLNSLAGDEGMMTGTFQM